nr:hypothetical protein [uncultured Desulfobulbus sp.]
MTQVCSVQFSVKGHCRISLEDFWKRVGIIIVMSTNIIAFSKLLLQAIFK